MTGPAASTVADAHGGRPSRAARPSAEAAVAAQAIHGMSYLDVWWMRLGTQHQRLRAGCPQENGAHERMHRTSKRQAIKPARTSCRAQQRNFDAFQREYNDEPPHERLDQQTPASQSRHSARPHPERLLALEYPAHYLVKKINTAETFRFRDKLLYLANALADQHSCWTSLLPIIPAAQTVDLIAAAGASLARQMRAAPQAIRSDAPAGSRQASAACRCS